jgi:hypothetical protein
MDKLKNRIVEVKKEIDEWKRCCNLKGKDNICVVCQKEVDKLEYHLSLLNLGLEAVENERRELIEKIKVDRLRLIENYNAEFKLHNISAQQNVWLIEGIDCFMDEIVKEKLNSENTSSVHTSLRKESKE